MKQIKFAVAVASVLALAAAGFGASVASTTAVHTQPNESSPTISFLNAGATLTPGTSSKPLPAGWVAVDLPGPHEAYVQNKDLAKSLDVVAGASIYLAPKLDGGVLAIAQPGDKTTITGLHGKWTQISLEKTLVGYVNVNAGPAASTSSASKNTTNPSPAPSTPRDVTATMPEPVAPPNVEPGHAAPTTSLAGSSASLPRQFQGVFVSTRSLLKPRRPYDWALNDDAGKRFAYLDVSKLLQTEMIEKYTGLRVVVYGPVQPAGDGRDIVIVVQSLQLR